ncbi:MAG: alpha/beta fold hydrolase [Acidimicrobiales bacterium]|nr:alpha/beta fold hydrolase [Acidimicrobiales bacterium]
MIWRFGQREIDAERFELRCSGTAVAVEPQVLDVLIHLAAHHDRVVTKEELLDEVWGDRFVSEATLTSRIKDARRAVEDDGRRQEVIRTVHGRGYQFVAPLEPRPSRSVDAAPSPAGSSAGAEPTGAPPAVQYTRSGGYDIAFQVVGDGPGDIVLIPGFVSNLDLRWELPPLAEFSRRLAELGRLIVFDKRGTGLSERTAPSRLPTLEERMDDVGAVMDAAGSSRATLFGISEGGPLALLFAASQPQRVDRLVIYGSFTHDPFVGADEMAEFVNERWGTGETFQMLAPTWELDERGMAQVARYERLSANPDSAARLVQLATEIDARPALPAIGAPTLVIHRTNDPIIPIDRGRSLAAGVAGARFVEQEGADHLPYRDSGPVLDLVAEFVTGVPAMTGADRVLATMLFVEVAGVPAQGAAETSRGQVERLLNRTEREVGRLGGTIVRATGQRLLVTLDGPARAVRCGQRLARIAEDLDLAVCCGVHTSEVERRGDELEGIGVLVGAGVARLADDGEVWVTRTVRDLVAGSGLRFEPRGANALDDVPGTWELYAAV